MKKTLLTFLISLYLAMPAHSINKDLYSRLGKFLKDIKSNPEFTGIIGISLGAYSTAMLLGYDAIQTLNNENIFGLGGIALSPTLHARTTYENLEKRQEDSQMDPSKGFTTKDNAFNYFRYRLYRGYEGFVAYFEGNKNDFIGRIFNEVTYADLNEMLLSINVDRRRIGEINYHNIFIHTGFRDYLNQDRYNLVPSSKSISLLSDEEISKIYALYDLFVNPVPYLQAIDRPLFLYLSKDDPLLFPDNPRLPETITDILEEASQNKNIMIFCQKYGGHSGLLLDPLFEELVYVFFSSV